jgi:hypothetical protein
MKKSIQFSAIVTLISFTLFYNHLSAQTVIYYQNFDSVDTLPAGWRTNSASWYNDTTNTNSSSGYAGASGLHNVVVKNQSSPAGNDSLISPGLSTLGLSDITVDWGCRNSNNFLDSGTTIVGFFWSSDSGTVWNNIPYTENSANSDWAWDNAGTAITLPAAVDSLPSVQFMWVVNIRTSSAGTYRIDDFTVASGELAGIQSVNKTADFAYIYVVNNSSANIVLRNGFTEEVQIDMYDAAGREVYKGLMSSQTKNVNISTFSSGLYLVKLSTSSATMVNKIVIR